MKGGGYTNYATYFIVSLGGFQFSYNFVIMAGAILFISPVFSLNRIQESYLMGSIVLGSLLGASTVGTVANHLGRKRTQLYLALFFICGALIVMFAPSFNILMTGRLVQGIAGGAVTVVVPLYLAELAPTQQRGLIVGLYQISSAFGVLFGYGASYFFSFSGSWRFMLGCSMIPALIYWIGLLRIEDTVCPTNKKNSFWKEVVKPPFRASLATIVVLNILQQVSGSNAILVYAPMIFFASGTNKISTALFSTLYIGVINVLSALISGVLIDSKGRRPLLMSSLSGMILSLLLITASFWIGSPIKGWLVIVGIVLYTISFGIGMGPIPGLIVSELFPYSMRGPAASFAALCNWIFNFSVVFTFAVLVDLLGFATTFAIYMVFAIIAFIFVWKKIPETIGCELR